jgi:Leucine-rich repeat (LRR) protein
MKTKLLVFVLFLVGFLSFSQQTYVPDNNFEQFLIDKGYDSEPLDDYVTTANINTVTELNISGLSIDDLTGIEGFTALLNLNCSTNNLTNLDISLNTLLTQLNCSSNKLTSLDVSKNISLTTLNCSINNLINLNVSQNTALTDLNCYDNNISILDLNNNTSLTDLLCRINNLSSLNLSKNTGLVNLNCNFNNLNSLDVKNGNNINMIEFKATNNDNLNCIEVDNEVFSTTNWLNIDSQSYFSEDCGYLATEDFELAGFIMSPNPISNSVKITINEEAHYTIINLNGKVLQEGILLSGANEIILSYISKGLYFLNIKTDSGFINKKLVKL